MGTVNQTLASSTGCGTLQGITPAYGLSPAQMRAKRIFDCALALPLLFLLAPLWIAASVAIRLSSNGPALFRQERIGLGGHPFTLFKFRTMTISGDDAHRAYTRSWINSGTSALQPGGSYKLACDPRITKIGRLLRKFSIDEIPQLLNVLRGEMSLIGPRPAMGYEVAEYQPQHFNRLSALPGISGLWQVSGRNRLSFEQMVELDLRYIETWSLRRDLQIALRTLAVVLRGTGQ